MGFSMPACVRNPETIPVLILVVTLALAGCSDPAANNRFELSLVEANWSSGWLNVRCEQRLVLSNEAKDALIHGVPLTVELQLRLRDTGSQTRVVNEKNSYEIRYLPLSNHYQLSFSRTATVKTFPRLRHVLAELSRLDLSFETGILPAGDYELLARTHLNQQRLPPPMRLPTLMSSNWRHDSSWSSWPVEIEPGA
jgi:hypothetical protein